jgi:hypothetical protein
MLSIQPRKQQGQAFKRLIKSPTSLLLVCRLSCNMLYIESGIDMGDTRHSTRHDKHVTRSVTRSVAHRRDEPPPFPCPFSFFLSPQLKEKKKKKKKNPDTERQQEKQTKKVAMVLTIVVRLSNQCVSTLPCPCSVSPYQAPFRPRLVSSKRKPNQRRGRK